MEHTEGHWTSTIWHYGESNDTKIMVVSKEHAIAEMVESYYPKSSDHAKKQAIANARLIAAAPDLLEACKQALEDTYIDSDVVELALEALSSVRSVLGQAIAKAEPK